MSLVALSGSFTNVLDVTRPKGGAEPEKARRDPAVIVVAHPHDGVRTLYVENILFLTKYRVIEAASGRDAVDRIRRHRPRVAMLPSSMPDLDTWDAIRALKRDPSTRDVRFLLIASREDARDHERATAAGVDGIIVEPMMPSEMIAQVKHAVSTRRKVAVTTGK